MTPEPIRHSLSVPLTQQQAFRAFTSDMARWWPSSNSLTRAAQRDVVLEPREGGRWYEESVEDEQCDWGYVLQWEPPTRLILAWQLDAVPGDSAPQKGLRHVPSLVSEVEITFTAQGEEATLVELEHRNLDRFESPTSARIWLDSARGGWPAILGAFSTTVGEHEPT